MRKSRYCIYIEFFEPQNPEWLENKLRTLAHTKQLPAYRELTVMVDHKNMKSIPDVPLVLTKDDKIEIQ